MTEQTLTNYVELNKKYVIGNMSVSYILQAYDEDSKKFIATGFSKTQNDIGYFYKLCKEINKLAVQNGQQPYKRFRVKKQTIINEEIATFNLV